MRIKNYIFVIFSVFILTSCFKDNTSFNKDKVEYKIIKDSLRKSIFDSIIKSDSLKQTVGIARLNKKNKVILYDNFKWEYQNKKNTKITKNKKIKSNQIRTLSQSYSENENEYVASGICGALTKKGGRCQRRVKGGGRCWQH